MSVTTFTVVGGQMMRQVKDGVVHDFVPDPLGSVVMVQDSSGAAVYRAEYDPYGKVQSETGTNPSSLGYVGTLGYIKDSATISYVRARYLLNNLGRWLTKDPLWPEETGFVYTRAMPNIYSDPGGLQPSKGKPIKIIPDKVHRINPKPAVHHDRPRETDPCSCPLNWLNLTSHYGYVYIDCSCKGRDMGVLPETCKEEIEGPGCDELNTRPKCGQWIPADAIQIDGIVYKVFGQSCVVISCSGGSGGFSTSGCCRWIMDMVGMCHPSPSNAFDDRRLRRNSRVKCAKGFVQ